MTRMVKLLVRRMVTLRLEGAGGKHSVTQWHHLGEIQFTWVRILNIFLRGTVPY